MQPKCWWCKMVMKLLRRVNCDARSTGYQILSNVYECPGCGQREAVPERWSLLPQVANGKRAIA